MKVILSRKGFDSVSGGYPSPIFPNGLMASLPIPDNNTSIYYKDLKLNENFSYLDLMNQLGLSKKFNKYSTAHIDPDINESILDRPSNWQAIFGQDNSSASHLNNQNVSIGDIFLFFGWFKKCIKTSLGYKYDPKDKNGRHIIFGYMQVGKKIIINNDSNYPKSYLLHPHFEYRDRKNNTAYIAADFLKFNSTISGAGTFKYNDDLVLSLDNIDRSIWKLPSFFHPSYGTKMTYHTNPQKWQKNDSFCTLQTVGRGQEFVISNNSSVEEWAKNIILNNT